MEVLDYFLSVGKSCFLVHFVILKCIPVYLTHIVVECSLCFWGALRALRILICLILTTIGEISTTKMSIFLVRGLSREKLTNCPWFPR